jgi:acyl carrier protein
MSSEVILKQIISEKLCIDSTKITPQSAFFDDLTCDSLDMVEIVMAIEDHFDIAIPDEDIDKLKTFKDLYEYVDSKV